VSIRLLDLMIDFMAIRKIDPHEHVQWVTNILSLLFKN